MRRKWPVFIAPVLLWLATNAFAQESRTTQFQAEFSRASELLDSGHSEDAIDAFKRANKLTKGSCAECYLGLSLAHFHLEDYKDALKNAKKALKYASTQRQRAKAHYFVGSALVALDDGNGKKLAEAEPALRAAVELEPDNATHRYQLGVDLLRQRKDAAGISELHRYLELAPGAARAEKVRSFIEYPRRAHSDYAPEFRIVTHSGQDVSSENQRGRVVVIDFWATWCPPCVESIPDLKRLHERYADQPFTLLSVSIDQDENAWREFIAENDMKWAQFHDAEDDVVKKFLPARFTIPRYVLIDSEGIVRATFGGGSRTMSKLRKEIGDILKELRDQP